MSTVAPEVLEYIEQIKDFWAEYYDQEVRETLVSDTR